MKHNTGNKFIEHSNPESLNLFLDRYYISLGKVHMMENNWTEIH